MCTCVLVYTSTILDVAEWGQCSIKKPTLFDGFEKPIKSQHTTPKTKRIIIIQFLIKL